MNARLEYEMAYRAIRKFFRLADDNDTRADDFYKKAMPCYDPSIGCAAIDSLIARRNAEWLLDHPSEFRRAVPPTEAQLPY